MTNKAKRLLLPCLALCAAWVPQSSFGAIKCWTNSEGVRECGNAVPPEYAQQGHIKVNKQGIAVGKTIRAKTKDELDAERRHAELTAMRESEAKRIAEERGRRDRILLQTFATEQDILLARDGHVAAIESRINHTQQVMRKVRSNLEDLEAEAAKQERQGHKVPEQLLADMANLRKQIDEHLESIELRRKERAQLEAKYDRDLARYREIRQQSSHKHPL